MSPRTTFRPGAAFGPHGLPGRCQRGFTMIEIIMVMVLLGIIAAMVSVFMKQPIDAYLNSAARAELTDAADGAVRRVGRDLRVALPFSVLPVTAPAGGACFKFIPTKTGGRYRLNDRVDAAGSALQFDAPDTRFNMLGAQSTSASQHIGLNDLIAIYNLPNAGFDAYVGTNVATVTAAPVPLPAASDGAELTLTIDAFQSPTGTGMQFPTPSPSNRFQVIDADEQVVNYLCTANGVNANGDGAGRLIRFSENLRTVSSTDCGTAPPNASVLANLVSACSFNYSNANLTDAVMQIELELTRHHESVRLYHEVHVDNMP